MDLCYRLTELKAESRKRREQREIDTAVLVAETRRRREIVEKQFYEWNDGKKVDCTLIYTALRTYADMYNGLLLFSRLLNPIDQDCKGFYLADYMMVYLPVAYLVNLQVESIVGNFYQSASCQILYRGHNSMFVTLASCVVLPILSSITLSLFYSRLIDFTSIGYLFLCFSF